MLRLPRALLGITGVLLYGVFVTSVPAAADPPADLSGTWRTVSAESESMEPIMKAQGISWLQRKAAGLVALEFIFRQNGNELQQELQSSFVTNSKKYRMNGPEYDDEDFRGRSIRSRDWWTESGDFTRRMEYESGIVLTVHRSLREDGRHIDVLFEVEHPDRPPQTVKRVLLRVDEGAAH